MDITSDPAPVPQNERDLVYLHATTANNGVTYGSALSVPAGYYALVEMGSQVYGAVGAGDYTIDEGAFPLLAQKLRLQPGQLPTKLVQLTIYVLSDLDKTVEWTAYPFVTKNRNYGVNYCEIKGRCKVHVRNPSKFIKAYKAGQDAVARYLSPDAKAELKAATPGRQAEAYVLHLIRASASIALNHMNLAPDQLPLAVGSIKETIGKSAEAALQEVGLLCTDFDVINVPVLHRSPCVGCKSSIVPTAYGYYQRRIGMYNTKREGNFCVPCAARVSAVYNATLLVGGWWSYWGILIVPACLAVNCFSFLYTAFGRKIPAIIPSLGPEPGVWPPPPLEEWGQEVRDRS